MASTRERHYDAAGNQVHSWMELKTIIRHQPSLQLLSRSMLFQLIICPFIEIGLHKQEPDVITVRRYGCGTDLCLTKTINAKSLCALRRFYKTCALAGWTVQETRTHVYFRRDARVIRDPLRRWS